MKSRTIKFAILLAVLSAVELNSSVLKPFLNESTYGFVMLVISVVVAALRVVTSSPLLVDVASDSESKRE